MTLQEFTNLSYKDRLRAAHKGVFVGGREEAKFMVLLYQLQSFYIEVYFHKKHNYITALEGFEDWEGLDPYLEKAPLNLENLLK